MDFLRETDPLSFQAVEIGGDHRLFLPNYQNCTPGNVPTCMINVSSLLTGAEGPRILAIDRH